MDGVALLGRLSPRRRALVLVPAALVVVALAAAVTVAVASGRRSGSGRPAQSRPGPVLLVPGYGGGQVALGRLADRLRAAGRTATVVTLPGDGTGDLNAQADTLDAAVRAAGAAPVDLVGYSAGGVVVRLWVARHGTAARVRRVVTLGSPLHGTRLAALGAALAPDACPLACQQLVPGNALLAALDRAPLPAGLPWLSLWTADDETVTPPDSARLAGAVNVALQSVCPDDRASHSGLPTDPLVGGLVRRALGTAPLAVPGPADCAVLRAAG